MSDRKANKPFWITLTNWEVPKAFLKGTKVESSCSAVKEARFSARHFPRLSVSADISNSKRGCCSFSARKNDRKSTIFLFLLQAVKLRQKDTDPVLELDVNHNKKTKKSDLP